MSDGKTFALQILSGKRQGGLVPLLPGKELLIGRAAGLDLVLVEDMISRRHAKIVVRDHDEVILEDLGSTNGTFVNGERVAEVRLREGDRILVGSTILSVVAHGEDMLLPSSPELPSFAPSGAMSGRLEEVSLPDILQMFGASQKSGTLHLQDREKSASLHLRQGRVVYASLEQSPTLPPLEAAYRILAWERGAFELQPQEGREFPEEITESTQALLMEALRRLDELRALPAPDEDAVFSLAPNPPPLRELTPEELDLIQLVYQHGRYATILDHGAGGDLELTRRLLSLTERGYLRLEDDA